MASVGRTLLPLTILAGIRTDIVFASRRNVLYLATADRVDARRRTTRVIGRCKPCFISIIYYMLRYSRTGVLRSISQAVVQQDPGSSRRYDEGSFFPDI